jgi:hypothetical protein
MLTRCYTRTYALPEKELVMKIMCDDVLANFKYLYDHHFIKIAQFYLSSGYNSSNFYQIKGFDKKI